MCLTAEARLLGHAAHVHMAHERDCGEMGHISYRSVPKWKPTKVRDGQLQSQSQYLWILNMWHTSLPTNLSNKSSSRLYGLSEITKQGPNFARVFEISRSTLGLACVIWQIGTLFICLCFNFLCKWGTCCFDRAVRAENRSLNCQYHR